MSEFLDFFLSKVAIAGFLPSALLLTLANYFVFDLGAESFYLPAPMLCVPIRDRRSHIFTPTLQYSNEWRLTQFTNFFFTKIRLPFDWKTPMGYPFAFLLQILAIHATILCTIPCLCSVIGTSWIFVVALKDMTNDLNLLMVDGQSLNNREETNKRFCKFVQFYLDLRELSANSSKLVYQVFTVH